MAETHDAPQGQLDGIGRYLTEVVSAVHGGFYRLALVGALIIPDIMAALGSNTGRQAVRSTGNGSKSTLVRSSVLVVA